MAEVDRELARYQDPAVIRRLLANAGTVAVVGLSSKPHRPSHEVAAFLAERGYRIIPVNPNETEVLGEKSYPNLVAVPEPIDLVDVFRTSAAVPAVVDDAIAAGAKALWLQLGVIHFEAAARARAAGLDVVMDRCAMRELSR